MIQRFAFLTLLAATPLAAQTMPAADPAAPPATPAPTAPPAPTAAPVPPSATPAPAVAPAPPPAATVQVTLTTSEGPIVLALEKQRAPITTAHFLSYLDARKLDGISFYRAVKVQDGFGFIQGGLRDPKLLGKPIPHEPTSRTGLTHDDGTISMARGAPGTANGDFFIIVGKMAAMDADPSKPGDNGGFAAFGHVVSGMEIVRHIMGEPTKAGGPAAMQGQMLAAPVKIISARRTG